MRIAIASWNRLKFGGAETYLDAAVPGLARAGQTLAMLYEVALPADREPIRLPADAPEWRYEAGGTALRELCAWRPEIIFVHGVRDPGLIAALPAIAPAVFYAHDYYGSCISGAKAFSFPRPRPCSHPLGWQCLLRYYPRRCGGLNPATMWRFYQRETRHREELRRYHAIITASEHMRREHLRNGFTAQMVRMIPPPIDDATEPRDCVGDRPDPAALKGWRLLFLGRMVELKGGALLIESAAIAAAKLRQRIHLTLAGDGPAREQWQRRAQRLAVRDSSLTVEFPGWLDEAERGRVLAASDLLIMPGLWPEPFGRSGLEAGLYSIPSVAFASGGIPEWLAEGVNGHLASAEPPTAAGLADAMVRSLGDPAHHATLRAGARQRAMEFGVAPHIAQLITLFMEVAGR
jgi:glycosyltransferase involved in cell wall biosynthesis